MQHVGSGSQGGVSNAELSLLCLQRQSVRDCDALLLTLLHHFGMPLKVFHK